MSYADKKQQQLIMIMIIIHKAKAVEIVSERKH